MLQESCKTCKTVLFYFYCSCADALRPGQGQELLAERIGIHPWLRIPVILSVTCFRRRDGLTVDCRGTCASLKVSIRSTYM